MDSERSMSQLNLYPNASTIDAVNDELVIWTNSLSAVQNINRNTLLNLSSQPVGLTDSQTLTNKTLTSPTVSSPTFSGTLAGTYTIGGTPTFPASVTQNTTVQTLTNKTLTSPTINSPTITNATISADTLTGYTTSNSGTIYGGISVTTGNVSMSGTLAVTVTLSSGAITSSGIIKASSSNPVWQYLGYAPSTSTFNTSSGTPVAITGLTVGVTIPSGVTKVRVSVWAQTFSVVSSGNPIVNIYSGATSSALTTKLATGTFAPLANYGPVSVVSITAPSSGSLYYTAALNNGASASTTLYATTTSPMFILVECC